MFFTETVDVNMSGQPLSFNHPIMKVHFDLMDVAIVKRISQNPPSYEACKMGACQKLTLKNSRYVRKTEKGC